MSLRLRLTLLSAALVTVTIAVIGIGLYRYIEQSEYDRLDSALRERTRQIESTLNRGAAEGLGVGTFTLPDPERLDAPQIYIQLYNELGRQVYPNLSSKLRLTDEAFNTVVTGRSMISTMPAANGTTMRVLHAPVLSNGRNLALIVQAATPITPLTQTLAQLRLVLLATGLIALALVGLGAWWTTGRALRAVDRIAKTAQYIESSQDLSQRILQPADAPDDEMGRLVGTFNNMLARLDSSFQAQRQFVSDSSHELRSPLTVIRGNLELWRKARTPDEQQAAVSAIEQETARMTRLVENLLFLAQMEAARPTTPDYNSQEWVELDSLLLMVYGQARVIGRNHQIVLAHEDMVSVWGNQDQLQQLLLNLVDNAIKYTPAGGAVRLGLYGDPEWARLEVADSGIGIPADDLPHIFDRFYRSDKARSRTLGGAGLGLAIVREVAEAHGGHVEVFSTPGEGTLFRVWLPRPIATTQPDEPLLPPAPELLPPPELVEIGAGSPAAPDSNDQWRRTG